MARAIMRARYLDEIGINRNFRRWIMKWRYKCYMNINQMRNEMEIARVKSLVLFSNLNVHNSRREREKEKGGAGRSEIGIMRSADLRLMKISEDIGIR